MRAEVAPTPGDPLVRPLAAGGQLEDGRRRRQLATRRRARERVAGWVPKIEPSPPRNMRSGTAWRVSAARLPTRASLDRGSSSPGCPPGPPSIGPLVATLAAAALIFISHVWYKSGAGELRRRESITAKATIEDSLRAELVAGGRRVAEAGLVVGSAGNLSLRAGERVLITRGGAELDVMHGEDCVEVGVGDSVRPEEHRSGPQPSSELALHLAIYAATDAVAIVHTHSQYATILSTVVDELPAIHYTINHFGGPVRVARYECFGTEDLANSVIDALRDRSGALMANHGAVAIAGSLRDAVAKAILLEWLASLYYHACLFGSPNILSESELEAVRDRARKLRYGTRAGVR